MNVLAIITTVLPVIERLTSFIAEMRAIGRQTKELTPEEDAELDARIALLFTPQKPDFWKTDAELDRERNA